MVNLLSIVQSVITVTNSNHQLYDKHQRDKEAKRFYNSAAWKKCRELVLKRDNYLCVECLKAKKISPADMVHHIEELKDQPSKALDEDNLVSLCNPCHNQEHGLVKKKENELGNKKINVIKAKANREMT